ncbi:MAG TPA: mechanosensitive ion channel [Methanofollis liminatans]|uniref:Mechanosensitive ion channel n=1 Tax=Methanofollis liminatans TaxID=2201 RepID=A0A831LRC5_9EURY|nr:mechanosensitive ion channel [Methanofollis liminatans]
MSVCDDTDPMADNGVMIGGVPLENVLIFILLFFVFIFAGNLCYALVRRALDPVLPRGSARFSAALVQYAVIFTGIYFSALVILDFDLTAFSASLGILSIVVAFSSAQIIQNVLAGMLIAVNRPIRLEEWIAVGGAPETGIVRVKDIALTTTTLRGQNGRLVTMPNSALLNTKIVNYTRSGFIRVRLALIMPRTIQVERVSALVLAAADREPEILPNVWGEEKSHFDSLLQLPSMRRLYAETVDLSLLSPKVLVSGAGPDTLTLSIGFWIQRIDHRDEIVSSFLRAILSSLEEDGITAVQIREDTSA